MSSQFSDGDAELRAQGQSALWPKQSGGHGEELPAQTGRRAGKRALADASAADNHVRQVIFMSIQFQFCRPPVASLFRRVQFQFQLASTKDARFFAGDQTRLEGTRRAVVIGVSDFV